VKETFHPLRRQYHRPHHALQDVSFDVKEGEFIGVIGRNGSGKSTLLQLISRVLQPTSGSIKVSGSISALLELGAGFNPEFTGRENVFMNGSLLGITTDEIESQFPNIEAFADIGAFIDQPVKTYSSGMFVRLAFAVAINVKPDILIVDEALAVGDIFFQQKCIRHMQEEMQHCTKVLVTHDMHAAMNLCSKIFVLDKGRLVFEGSPIEGVEHYTKMVQNELFKIEQGAVSNLVKKSHEPAKQAIKENDDEPPWTIIEDGTNSGAGEIKILKARLTYAESHKPVVLASASDLLCLEMQVETANQLESVLFGYMIKDRVGNGICGDNTLSLKAENFILQKGTHLVSIIFSWPEIAPDNYLITLGIGQGTHPLHHVIQCWAHNALMVKSMSSKEAVHGIFTNPITECEVRTID
jgi:ABC-type polysaccharide/polyol phosphate transport system ATPase subunit